MFMLWYCVVMALNFWRIPLAAIHGLAITFYDIYKYGSIVKDEYVIDDIIRYDLFRICHWWYNTVWRMLGIDPDEMEPAINEYFIEKYGTIHIFAE